MIQDRDSDARQAGREEDDRNRRLAICSDESNTLH